MEQQELWQMHVTAAFHLKWHLCFVLMYELSFLFDTLVIDSWTACNKGVHLDFNLGCCGFKLPYIYSIYSLFWGFMNFKHAMVRRTWVTFMIMQWWKSHQLLCIFSFFKHLHLNWGENTFLWYIFLVFSHRIYTGRFFFVCFFKAFHKDVIEKTMRYLSMYELNSGFFIWV